MAYNGMQGVWIEQTKIKEINHKLLYAIECKEYSDSLEIAYNSLSFYYDMQTELLDLYATKLDIYETEKNKTKLFLQGSVAINVILVLIMALK